ncbi:hypothetical protein JD844_002602 [Phrynosoma platyrhinos]|uniref:Proteasome subunit alpha type-2 n=1 Tax=Phrynosoma platyrhinos TaxID=52577 RepID=A0ABQ7TCJ5_PHRPL|nr:hypothetical protein JD844_002602 [Phrynosoma platyrhinos]
MDPGQRGGKRYQHQGRHFAPGDPFQARSRQRKKEEALRSLGNRVTSLPPSPLPSATFRKQELPFPAAPVRLRLLHRLQRLLRLRRAALPAAQPQKRRAAGLCGSRWRSAATASPSPPSAANGVVLATEKKQKSILYDERSVHKVEPITKHIGLVYSGMGPDYRVLVHRARKLAQQYYLVYHEPIPTAQLVQRIASVMQEYTQSGYAIYFLNSPIVLLLLDLLLISGWSWGVRPFGVSLLICGWNEGRPYLFQSDPSGAYFAWKATAMGKNYVNGKTFLEKRYNEDLELEDAIHTAILTLKESFEGQMTEDNIEVGICNEAGFRRLTPTEVKDYLAAIA